MKEQDGRTDAPVHNVQADTVHLDPGGRESLEHGQPPSRLPRLGARGPVFPVEHAAGNHRLDFLAGVAQGCGNVPIVLADRRSDLRHRRLVSREPERQVGHPDPAERGVVLLDHHSPRPDLRILQHLVDPLHLRAGHARRLQGVQARAHRRLPCRPGLDLRAHIFPVKVATLLAVESRVRGERLSADQRCEPEPEGVRLGGDHEVAVAARKHAVHGGLGQVVAGLDRDLLTAAQRVALHRVLVNGDHAVVERKVDMLAAPAGHSPEQRRVDRGHSVNARVHVGERDAEEGRRLAGDPDHGHRATLRLRDQAESRVVGVRTAVAVGRDRAVHQARVARGEIRVPQPEPFERPRPVVLDEDVRAVDEAMHQLEPPRVAHVHAKPLLAHVLLQEVAAVSADEVGVRAASVAPSSDARP